jgi:hypothetical protein
MIVLLFLASPVIVAFLMAIVSIIFKIEVLVS